MDLSSQQLEHNFKDIYAERKNSNQMIDEASNAVLTNQKIRNGMSHESYQSNGEMATGVSQMLSGVISRASMPGIIEIQGLQHKSQYPKNRQR